jgi:beta-glucosidase
MKKGKEDVNACSRERASKLLSEMTLKEKIGQVNQRLYGFQAYHIIKNEQGEDSLILSEVFKQEVKKYGGLGVLFI